jgi:tRNA pseudouridine38-40 synthase
MMRSRNVKLTLGFDGTDYRGWQCQERQRTVQGELREAIRKITGENVMPVGCGRTDAGTHARSFTANFITTARIPPANLVRALNSVMPRDLRVLSARIIAASFHARRSARSKIYRYQVYRGEVMPPHLAREYFHFPYPIDMTLVERGAGLLVGTHDFASYAASGSGKRSTVRSIYRFQIRTSGRRLIFTVEGNGFLHHMVRNMVGTLLELGRGLISWAEFEALFDLRDRTRAGFTAPARGLQLVRAKY